MTANTLKLGGALALLTCFGAAAGAEAEPELAPERARDQGLPVRTDDAVSARVPERLVARLSELEAERRQKRAQALVDPKAWAAGRAQRALLHRQEIAQVWGNVVNSIDGQAKLRMHAERMSRLNRMLDLAEHAADPALLTRIRTDITRELVRHARTMQVTVAAAGAP